MRRRAFVTLLGGAAAWPLAASAQQAAKLPTIGYLGTAAASAWAPWTAAFVQRLHELGWIDGRTVAIQYRWAEGRSERLGEIAAEFVWLKVDVIVTGGNAAVAAKQASSVIPIVFALVDDPVGSGLVASLARPGGNVTGLSMQSTDLAGKRLALLREVCTVCCWGCARNHAPGPNQHFGAHCTNADNLLFAGVRRSGRSYVLRTKFPRLVPARRRLRRQDSPRGEARRHPGPAADQI